ncbi:Mur ligase family protein [Thermobrachium celere]|uniref:UDP-N-acetylmuramyl-tripeptide synthetase n=1 Tax=Thermobrachium celere DSM 8682 TaxID=941824 RepID=R7RR15_9CLOT|nr:Mur ligase family protein [Thermobrachium celere]GFR35215.1 hypothetical protein TCEA9_10270 [Thermobrachium celere]CDF58499.1 UDP-N-acetylmuramyl-tripeptide synthetase [Thermobrachium celere DSM 8682]
MRIIGVFGSRGKSFVGDFLLDFFKKHNKSVYIIGTKEDSEESFFKLLTNNIEYVIIEISREDILNNRIKNIKFDVLIHTALEFENANLIKSYQNLICNLKENGYIILNADSIQKIEFVCEKVYPITYGLNERTTVTASSIDDMNGLCFSFCLQRSIVTINGKLIQPFEKPLSLKGKYQDIYYYLASISALLCLDYEI